MPAQLIETIPRPDPPAIVQEGAVYARISGVFCQANARSLNNRFYPEEVVRASVLTAEKRLANPKGRPIQMVTSHAAADADSVPDVVGRVTRIYMDGEGNARYEGELANTNAGREMATLLSGGFHDGVSLRADPRTAQVSQGRINNEPTTIVNRFDTDAIDFTLRPGLVGVARNESIQIFESVDPASLDAQPLRPGETYSRFWYGLLTEAMRAPEALGLAAGASLDLVVREWLPILEAHYDDPGHYSTTDRRHIPPEDFGIPPTAGQPGKYPIVVAQDVHDAADLIGKAAHPTAVKARIAQIAKRKGFTLPAAWQGGGGDHDREPEGGEARESQPGVADAQAILREAHVPCSHCTGGQPAACTCPGCASTGACWCCAKIHPTQPKEGTDQMTAEEIQALFDQKLTERLAVRMPDIGVAADALSAALVSMQITEEGREISEANRAKLTAAHHHIANTLGMECGPDYQASEDGAEARLDAQKGMSPIPQQQGGLEGLDTGTEAARSIAGIVEAALDRRFGRQAAYAAPAPTFAPTYVNGAPAAPAADLTVLTSAMAAMAEANSKTQASMAALTEGLPAAIAASSKAAAEAAIAAVETAEWRSPGRKTRVAENDEAAPESTAGALPEGSLEAQLQAIGQNKNLTPQSKLFEMTQILQPLLADGQIPF